MIHTPENSKDKILVDVMGKTITGVLSFNDETNEAEIVVPAQNGWAIENNPDFDPELEKEYLEKLSKDESVEIPPEASRSRLVTAKVVIHGAQLVDNPAKSA